MKKSLISVFGAVVSATIGVAGTILVYEVQNSTSYVDVYVDPKTSIVAMDGDEIRDYGKVTVSLVNYSYRDLEYFEFYLDLTRKDGGVINLKKVNYAGKSGIKELVSELPVKTPSTDGAIRKKFRVVTANRADYDQFFFSIDYIVDGKVVLDQVNVELISLTQGVEVRTFDIEHTPRIVHNNRKAWLLAALVSIGVVVIIFLVIFPLSTFLTRPIDAKLRRAFAGDIYSALQNHQAFEGASEDAKKLLARDLAYLQRRNFYETKSRLYRYVFGLSKPSRDDYEILRSEE